MIKYNPFNKQFDALNEQDLEILKNIPEGMYIEYKGKKPNSKSIAKSISSFANGNGGLYFIGISSDKEKNTATDIVGVKDNIDVIRDSVHGNINPFPVFDTHTIQLSNKNQILLAVVPAGENTPYIHNDGRIYRRNGAASDPIPENDRHAIDNLYKRSKKYYNKIKEFRQLDFTYSETESNPYLSIFINTSPFNNFVFNDFFSDRIQKKIFTHFNSKFTIPDDKYNPINISLDGNTNYDTISTYPKSFVLRNLESNNLAHNGETIEIDLNGNFKVATPLTTTYYDHLKLSEDFFYFIESKKYESINFINFIYIKDIFNCMIGVIYQYLEFLKQYNYKNNLEFCFSFDNCWRTSIYSTSSIYMNYINEFGLPICMKDTQVFPSTGFQVNFTELVENPLLNLINIFTIQCSALGLPTKIATSSILDEFNKKK